MKAIGYIRVSTADQATDGYGLAAQEARIREQAHARGLELLDIARDEGLSAKSLERPALMSALQRIAERDADGLIVAKLDRLSRSARDFALLVDWFEDMGATLVALDFDLDTSTPSGRLIAHIFAAVAEWEREAIASRTREGLRAARAQGKRIGPVAVQDVPGLADRIRGLRAEGLSLGAICAHLEAEGVPTVRGGLLWRPSAVQSVLGGSRRASRGKAMALPERRR